MLRRVFIENKKLITIIAVFIIGLGIGAATVSFVFSDDVTVDVKLDGENSTVNMLALPFNGHTVNMKKEMENFAFRQMFDVDSNVTTLKEGLTEIANKHGFKDVNVNIYSQFGKDTMPMLITVDGVSMVPTLQDGERVIIEKSQNPKVGDIIVARDSEKGLLIKRLGDKKGDQIFLASDNNDTIVSVVNGVPLTMVAVEKWTDASNVVGIARIFNV